MAETWDVFISYAHADQDWVRTLATNLHNLGLDVFRDEWEIDPTDVLVHRLDEGLRTAAPGYWWSRRLPWRAFGCEPNTPP